MRKDQGNKSSGVNSCEKEVRDMPGFCGNWCPTCQKTGHGQQCRNPKGHDGSHLCSVGHTW